MGRRDLGVSAAFRDTAPSVNEETMRTNKTEPYWVKYINKSHGFRTRYRCICVSMWTNYLDDTGFLMCQTVMTKDLQANTLLVMEFYCFVIG